MRSACGGFRVHGIEEIRRRTITGLDIETHVSVIHALAEVVVGCARVSGSDSIDPVTGTDIVEDQIAARSPIVRPPSDTDTFAVRLAEIGNDCVASSVALDLLIPDMNSGSTISCQCICEREVIMNRFFEEDAVPSITGGNIEKGRVIERRSRYRPDGCPRSCSQ